MKQKTYGRQRALTHPQKRPTLKITIHSQVFLGEAYLSNTSLLQDRTRNTALSRAHGRIPSTPCEREEALGETRRELVLSFSVRMTDNVQTGATPYRSLRSGSCSVGTFRNIPTAVL